MKDTEYWDSRYNEGGTSGIGSRGDHAIWKAHYINDVIKAFPISSIVELGHGDGYMLNLYEGYKSYDGYDISSVARESVREAFKSNHRVTIHNSISSLSKRDICISIDVLYHITDTEQWKLYISNLFRLGNYVLIYSQDNNHKGADHVYNRVFTEWIETNIDSHALIEVGDGYHDEVKFYLYKEKYNIVK